MSKAISSAVNKTAAPLLIYLPSYPYSGYADVSTFSLSYNMDTQQMMAQNGLDVATMGGADQDWPTCLACASLARSMQRSKTQIPSKCQKCFQKFCWDGVVDDKEPPQYAPKIGLPNFISSNGTDKNPPPAGGPTKAPDADEQPKANGAPHAASLSLLAVAGALLSAAALAL